MYKSGKFCWHGFNVYKLLELAYLLSYDRLHAREDGSHRVCIAGLTETEATDEQQLMQVITVTLCSCKDLTIYVGIRSYLVFIYEQKTYSIKEQKWKFWECNTLHKCMCVQTSLNLSQIQTVSWRCLEHTAA